LRSAAEVADDTRRVTRSSRAGRHRWLGYRATLAEARAAAGKVQGRRTTASSGPPIEVPEGSGT